MKYWVAYDNDNHRGDRVVAFHEDKEVVQEYINSVEGAYYSLGKCKHSELKKIPNVDELYLVEFHNTYIQLKFYDCEGDFTDEELSEVKHTIHLLEKFLRIGNPSTPQTKAIHKTIRYLNEIRMEFEEYVPDYDYLQRKASDYEMQLQMFHNQIDMSPADKFLQ